MTKLRYNQNVDKKPFSQWCDENGIEVITSWDAGMYGNIGYKVRKDGVEYEASAYQSIGPYGSNFKFDLNI